MKQEIHFCQTPDGAQIAYATVGQGPPLVKTANWLTHLEYDWRSPVWRHMMEELSRNHMFVRYDQRGCGLSDRETEDLSVEAWVKDLETVIDSLNADQVALLGISQGGPAAITYAVRYPERVSHLILYGTLAQGARARPGISKERAEQVESLITLTRLGWGQDNPAFRQIFTTGFIPEGSREQIDWLNDLQRISTSGENAAKLLRETSSVDVSNLLTEIKVPVLVLHSHGDALIPFEGGREMAASIRGSRFVPLESKNHYLLENEPAWDVFLSEVRRFLGVPDEPTPVTAAQSGGLMTIMFTDIESSTALTQRLGDEKAQEQVVRMHNRIVRSALDTHGGTEIKGGGDGIMASFPSVWRALACGIAIQRAIEEMTADTEAATEFHVNIGLNAGEPIAEEDDLFGSSVILASRICDRAKGGQILVPDAVRHLAAGKGFLFSDQGDFLGKGFEEPVRVYEVRWRADS